MSNVRTYDFSKTKQRVTDAANDLNLGKVVECLEQSLPDMPAPEASALIRIALNAIVQVRDKGNAPKALDTLLALWRTYKSHDICVELLVILTVVRPSADGFNHLAKDIPAHIRENGRIQLLLANGYSNERNVVLAAEHLRNARFADISDVPSFVALRKTLIARIIDTAATVIGAMADQCDIPGLADQSRNLAAASVVQRLKDLSPTEFDWQLRNIAFIGPASERQPLEVIARAIEILSECTTPENLVVALRMLVSIRFHEQANALAERLYNIEAIRQHPGFVKSIVKLDELVPSELWTQRAMECSEAIATGKAPEWEGPRVHLQRPEVIGRFAQATYQPTLAKAHKTLPPTVKNTHSGEGVSHLFVGIFGQLRFPNAVLPTLNTYLNHPADRPSDCPVSFGISTWDKVGHRMVATDDPIVFVLDLLPGEIASAVNDIAPVAVKGARQILPRTVDRILDSQLSGDQVTAASISAIWGDNIAADISTDRKFMEEKGQFVAARCNNDPHFVNQARMWNRIAGLQNLLVEAEKSKGIPVSHAILLRSDLKFHHGSLVALVESVARMGSNCVFADHDPHANYIEGLGDRFMVADRTALDRILDAERLMQMAAAKGDTIDQTYIKRFAAHEFLDTILFEHGSRVVRVPSGEVGFEIFRGRWSVADLRQELLADFESAPPSVKAAIKIALGI